MILGTFCPVSGERIFKFTSMLVRNSVNLLGVAVYGTLCQLSLLDGTVAAKTCSAPYGTYLGRIWTSSIILTCTCRGIPIAPSRRMLETLLLDEDSLLLTWSILTVFRVFNAVLCIFMGCFSSDFFPLHPTISIRSSAVF